MALIQIRDVPEDVYESIRRRARRAGQSIQAYMLARTVEIGRRPTPDEVLAELDGDLATRPPLAVDTDALLADRDADRP
jgi:plasmid stability protein